MAGASKRPPVENNPPRLALEEQRSTNRIMEHAVKAGMSNFASQQKQGTNSEFENRAMQSMAAMFQAVASKGGQRGGAWVFLN